MHNGLACKMQGLHNRTLTLPHYTRQDAHTGDETFKKGAVDN